MTLNRPCCWLLIGLLWLPMSGVLADSIRIGVLSHRGYKATLEVWAPTARYLSREIPGHIFDIRPLDFDQVDAAVRNRLVDFVLVNPGIYVNLEVRYRVSRIATLNNRRANNLAYNVFGGVLFTRADRRDIRTITDLRGKRLMAVDHTSLGGFQMAWRELNAQGLDPYRDLRELTFGGTHDAVVMGVREGLVDAGTVRTDILERMAADGVIGLDEFHIINPRTTVEFPFALSTRLYPEWPLSKVAHTPKVLAEQVALALLKMPKDHPAALAGRYAGWTIPLDYQQVHELFRELNLPPYDAPARFTLADALVRYWYWLVVALITLLCMGFLTVSVLRLNRALKRSKQRLEQQHELILNSVADGIYGVDLDGNSTFVNRAMERITGWTADDLIGRNQHEILHHTRADGSPHPKVECPVYATFRDNIPRYVAEDTFWRRDGTSLQVEYSSNPIQDGNGRTVGSVVVFRDIAERKRAEEEMRRHQLELAHVARLSLMGEMASSIAHELNQPLTAIATNAHACIRMLESGRADNEQCADVIERMAAQAERAGEIIRQIRAFVRKEEQQRSPAAVNDLVRGVAALLAPELRRARVRLRLVLGAKLPLVVVQPIQIEQVVVNLVRNAVEAMVEADSPVREIAVVTAGDDDAVRISVEDSGPGIDPQVAGRVFEPFVTTKKSGTGLGLSISFGIVDAHGGRLEVEPQPGGGSRFQFTLPLPAQRDERDEQRAESLHH